MVNNKGAVLCPDTPGFPWQVIMTLVLRVAAVWGHKVSRCLALMLLLGLHMKTWWILLTKTLKRFTLLALFYEHWVRRGYGKNRLDLPDLVTSILQYLFIVGEKVVMQSEHQKEMIYFTLKRLSSLRIRDSEHYQETLRLFLLYPRWR